MISTINIRLFINLILIMDEQIKDNHIESLAPPSYSSSFKNILVTSGVANFAIKTILAPLERWKIISQTQMTYSLRPKKFSGFFDYLQRTQAVM